MTIPLFSRRVALLGGAGLLAAPAIVRAQGAPAAPAGAAGQVIDINRARTDPIPIALPDFAGSSPAAQQLGQNITRVISNNLKNSGLFRPVDRAAFIQSPEAAAATPRFQDWRVVGAQALVTGRAEPQGDRSRIEFRLWEVNSEQQLQGTAYTANAANWRQIAHVI